MGRNNNFFRNLRPSPVIGVRADVPEAPLILAPWTRRPKGRKSGARERDIYLGEDPQRGKGRSVCGCVCGWVCVCVCVFARACVCVCIKLLGVKHTPLSKLNQGEEKKKKPPLSPFSRFFFFCHLKRNHFQVFRRSFARSRGNFGNFPPLWDAPCADPSPLWSQKTHLMDLNLIGYMMCLWLSGSRVLGGYPIWWSLALGQQYSSLGSQPILCGSIPGLVPKQLRFCRNYIEIMPSVAEGVKLGIQECQHQFRGRRWNCTTIKDNLAIFGPVLDKATRESAFVHAIASAGVAYAVTRSCAEGTSTMCGCDSHHKGPPGEGWKWGGCSEDAEFGVLVSREFADARENRPDARSAMNRHNNEAGRMTILENMHLRCKCHGLSGSCEVKTCWLAMPDFRLLGDFLKDKYDSASEMVVEKHRESRGWVETLRAKYTFFKHPTERDLVYYEGSPNFCEPNPETGSFGTRDRVCNVSSHGIEGCDLLCCGRGHNTRTEKRKEKCHCIFHWCCYVSCQECVRVYDVHTCK
uniref:Protein Wnt n=3 Tax=Denticeps clupeoides TaxID=299321 RepID=A0AAY4D5R8_9TELE